MEILVDGTFPVGSEKLRVVLPSLIGGEAFDILANTSLIHNSIEISAQQAEVRSDFWLEFMVASNVLMPQVVDHVSSYFVDKALYKIFEEPKDPNVKNAVQAASLETSIGGIPSLTMASIWSFYQMLPDYELAVMSGKIVESSGDWRDNTVFKRSLEKFRSDGILVRNPQGQLEYPKTKNGTRYENRVYTTWINFSQQLMREGKFQKSLHRA